MSHPLNRPYVDIKKRRVTDGYGILQPRVAVSLPGTNRSLYARLFGTEPGIDPYTRAISDVYQDLFGEGSFIGKGIYDVDAFEQTLKDRFPENRILSHDLLEGCYTRSGLLSDVLLFEEYPPYYGADVIRRSRWIRGDWQLMPWLLPFLPLMKGVSRKNPLSFLSWWKIADNLRRSLIPLSLMLLLITGWTVLSSSWFWTLVVIGIIIIPPLIISSVFIFRKPEEVNGRQHLRAAGQMLTRQLMQCAFIMISLPYEAFYSTGAILRTCWRMIISKRHLLEWNTAAGRMSQGSYSLAGSFLKLWISPFIAIISCECILILFPEKLAILWPVIGLWFVFPAIAWWISRPLVPYEEHLTAKQNSFLFILSRKTWSFFETFVGPEDNWLPPDNYQEHPVSVTAHRTSPTNIGLSLLANLSAYDFGYIHTGELLERTGKAFYAMNSMERYNGHFYNWYDTKTLEPLRPLYISSVDSGNLAGHLLTLQQGLINLPDELVTGPRLFEGIKDTLMILAEKTENTVPAGILQFRKYLDTILKEPPVTVGYLRKCLQKLSSSAIEIVSAITPSTDEQYRIWADNLAKQCLSALNELPDSYAKEQAIPTLREIAGNDSAEPGIIEDIRRAKERIALIEEMRKQSAGFAEMEYGFLYDRSRHLQTVGYDIEDRRQDSSYYDLLASEARLASFVAIARDQVPQESWFALGRLLTTVDGEPVLLSWSGSMFEYLMPLLVMPSYENSLLHQTCRAAVLRQIEYSNT